MHLSSLSNHYFYGKKSKNLERFLQMPFPEENAEIRTIPAGTCGRYHKRGIEQFG